MIEATVKVGTNGSKYWYLNDKLHREDGPAIEYNDGDKYWYLKGKLLTEAEHKAATSPLKEVTCNGTLVTTNTGNQHRQPTSATGGVK